MFKEKYIIGLLSGRLTFMGYNSILGTIAIMAKKYHWQKSIIVSEFADDIWSKEDIEELTQMFFEWVIANGKLKYLDKVPYEYLSYYFTQMLVSFVADRIKEEQQKIGVSYQKCQELVKSICAENYSIVVISDKECVKNPSVDTKVVINDIEEVVRYMAKYTISENTKQYKPLIKLAIEDILINAEGYVPIDSLCKGVFILLDQKAIRKESIELVYPIEMEEPDKYDKAVSQILTGVTNSDAKIYLDYIFQELGKASLSEIAQKYGLPKSSLHKKNSGL